MTILRFPRKERPRPDHDQVRPSVASEEDSTRRAEIAARILRLNPDARATLVAQIADHHSDGMLSRCGHLRTAGMLWPISTANASGERQRPITSRKFWNRRDMESELGQFVLIGKRILSCDCELSAGHNVLMAKSAARTKWREQFATRVKKAREARGLSQTQIATALGIKQDRYKHYEVDRFLPHDMIEAFCLACDIEPEFLYPQGRRPKRSKAA